MQQRETDLEELVEYNDDDVILLTDLSLERMRMAREMELFETKTLSRKVMRMSQLLICHAFQKRTVDCDG
jgi:hypothetical protein